MQELEFKKLPHKKMSPKSIYFIWGYNRAWHSKSDMYFKTPEGDFNIGDAVGKERQSAFRWDVYANLKKPSFL